MVAYDIRVIGDPVLRQRASEVTEIDGRLARIVGGMAETMYHAEGLGLAATQVGVKKRIFVWDLGDGLRTIVNPRIVESHGEWCYEEGCLSVPGLSWDIVRPKQVHVVGRDLDGNEMSIEADELEARLFQHELDHLDGTLLIEHLDDATRKKALRRVRELGIGPATPQLQDPSSPLSATPTVGAKATSASRSGRFPRLPKLSGAGKDQGSADHNEALPGRLRLP